MNISIIIPCYNEEEVLPLTLKSLKALALDLVSREDCSEIEFVMVDDGSQDRTFELLTEASKADKRVKVIRFSRNFGHQAALLAGYEFAKGDVIVSLDSDLQDPPELIKTMLDKIKEGYDVVFAARQSRKNDSWFKRKTAGFCVAHLTAACCSARRRRERCGRRANPSKHLPHAQIGLRRLARAALRTTRKTGCACAPAMH